LKKKKKASASEIEEARNNLQLGTLAVHDCVSEDLFVG
jgi:hypothetical protein